MFIYFIYMNATYRFNSFFNMKKDQWQNLLIYLKFHYSEAIILRKKYSAMILRHLRKRLSYR